MSLWEKVDSDVLRGNGVWEVCNMELRGVLYRALRVVISRVQSAVETCTLERRFLLILFMGMGKTVFNFPIDEPRFLFLQNCQN